MSLEFQTLSQHKSFLASINLHMNRMHYKILLPICRHQLVAKNLMHIHSVKIQFCFYEINEKKKINYLFGCTPTSYGAHFVWHRCGCRSRNRSKNMCSIKWHRYSHNSQIIFQRCMFELMVNKNSTDQSYLSRWVATIGDQQIGTH